MKSGFVAILGLPNAGKSTLINALVGSKVAIVSPKAQTTRDAVQGILHRPEGQIIFIDSPGIHEPKFELGRRMTREIDRAAHGCAAVVYVADAQRAPGEREAQALERLRRIEAPAILALNKVDRVTDKRAVLARIDEYRRLRDFAEYVPLAALSGDGLDILVRLIFERLPEGPPFYPDDYVTDQSERFLGAELIRERILRETRQEVPHHSAVVVERWEESRKLLRVAAVIYVERPSQKAILLGQKGAMMKQIATRARESIEARFEKHVYLELFVKVKPKWRDSAGFIRELDRARAGAGASALQIDDSDPLP